MTGKIVDLNVYSSMKIFMLKELLQQKEGIPIDQQRLIRSSLVQDDERTLQWYNIQNGSMIHLVLRLRGGMYHFTSGRQDFNTLSSNCAKAIQDVIEFKIQNMNYVSLLSSADLQNLILQAQDILSNLYDTVEEVSVAANVQNLKNIILPISADKKDSSDSDDN
jgi:hypothetical protein